MSCSRFGDVEAAIGHQKASQVAGLRGRIFPRIRPGSGLVCLRRVVYIVERRDGTGKESD
jgi:hypothetical protein